MAERIEQSEPDSEFVKPGDAARQTSLSTRTLARLADEGKLQAFYLPSGHRRYRRDDLDRLTKIPAA